jgi:hypothetical protein
MCEHCNDTGSLSKDIDGFLDCPHCDAAIERAGLEQWAGRELTQHSGLAAMWLIYQHGKATAAGATNTN